MNYETLDAIADSYIPCLAIISLILVITEFLNNRSQWRALLVTRFFLLVGLLVLAYGLMIVDSQLRLWSLMQLDYSTHTAVSLVLVLFLCDTTTKFRLLWPISFLFYVGLMLYQQYHTVADILSTMVAVVLLIICFITCQKMYHYFYDSRRA